MTHITRRWLIAPALILGAAVLFVVVERVRGTARTPDVGRQLLAIGHQGGESGDQRRGEAGPEDVGWLQQLQIGIARLNKSRRLGRGLLQAVRDQALDGEETCRDHPWRGCRNVHGPGVVAAASPQVPRQLDLQAD